MISNFIAALCASFAKFERLALVALNRREVFACTVMPSAYVLATGMIAIIINPSCWVPITCESLLAATFSLLLMRKFWVETAGAFVMGWALLKYGPETADAVLNHRDHYRAFDQCGCLKDFRLAVAAVARKLGEA